MKRVFDLLAALVALVVLVVPMVFVALLVYLKLGRPIFFCQKRPGKNGVPFTMYKFRTMSGSVGSDGKLLADFERISTFGHRLRSTSLDELPGLLNVLKGDMSIVGPRPLLVEYLPLYTAEQAKRHDVRPGITGWAQVNGRNSVTWDEKFVLDVWYVENQSLMLDLKILWLTLGKVFKRDGINAPGDTTMPVFRGNGK